MDQCPKDVCSGFRGSVSRKMSIKIKPSHRGELRRETHTKKDKDIPVSTLRRLKKSGSTKEKKQATFALNARKWKHK